MTAFDFAVDEPLEDMAGNHLGGRSQTASLSQSETEIPKLDEAFVRLSVLDEPSGATESRCTVCIDLVDALDQQGNTRHPPQDLLIAQRP